MHKSYVEVSAHTHTHIYIYIYIYKHIYICVYVERCGDMEHLDTNVHVHVNMCIISDIFQDTAMRTYPQAHEYICISDVLS